MPSPPGEPKVIDVLVHLQTNETIRLGKDRYVVEQPLAALHHNRRLKVRYEKRPDIHLAFPHPRLHQGLLLQARQKVGFVRVSYSHSHSRCWRHVYFMRISLNSLNRLAEIYFAKIGEQQILVAR